MKKSSESFYGSGELNPFVGNPHCSCKFLCGDKRCEKAQGTTVIEINNGKMKVTKIKH